MSKKDEALKLAVEAAVEQYAKTGSGKVLDAAMRQIIANEALNKMAENAKELGLDYEPAQQQEPSHSDIQLAEQIMSDCGCSTNNQRLLERITERLAKHRPAQQQEPVAWASSLDFDDDDQEIIPAKDKGKLGTNNCDIPLYTAPPKHDYVIDCPRCGHCCAEREWVGLTDEEIVEVISGQFAERNYWVKITKALEAKLKERNT